MRNQCHTRKRHGPGVSAAILGRRSCILYAFFRPWKVGPRKTRDSIPDAGRLARDRDEVAERLLVQTSRSCSDSWAFQKTRLSNLT
jgi:hypothetical protein